MKKLWLVKEPCTVWFNVKPIHEVLGTEKLSSSVEIELTEDQYDRYLEVVEWFNSWQEIFEEKINGRK